MRGRHREKRKTNGDHSLLEIDSYKQLVLEHPATLQRATPARSGLFMIKRTFQREVETPAAIEVPRGGFGPGVALDGEAA